MTPQEKLALLAAKLAPQAPAPTLAEIETKPKPAIILNEEQLSAVTMATTGKSFCLVGPAGSGKSTTVSAVVDAITTKYSLESVAIVAYTRAACRASLRTLKNSPAAARVSTIHKLLKYVPVPYEYQDSDGNLVASKRFEPTHHQYNPLPDIKVCIVEEASMTSAELFKILEGALPNAIFIFIGDLNQLQPPMSSGAILGYKLCELPVVELSKIYRQALDSKIVGFQHTYTLKGKAPSDTELRAWAAGSNDFILKEVPKTASPDVVCNSIANYLLRPEVGYNPTTDIILCPQNVKLGTILLNKYIAQRLGERRNAVVWEVIAGFNKFYFAVGDTVTYDKETYTITAISPNGAYRGAEPVQPCTSLSRWGTANGTSHAELDFDDLVAQIDLSHSTDEDTRDCASAIITLQSVEGATVELSTRGEISALELGYATTVYKAQGSEWSKVYFVMTAHHQGRMRSREQLYTAMTRAREQITLFYTPQSMAGKKDSSIAKAILSPEVAGTGWRDKKAHFMAKYQDYLSMEAQY